MPENWDESGFETRAIHIAQDPDPLTGAVVPAINLSTTYKQDGVGNLRGGFEYSRSSNPTRSTFEECLAGLEAPGVEGAEGFAFASGLAAGDCVIQSLLKPGDHAVIPDDAYGGTFRLFDKVAKPWGVDYTVAKMTDLDAVRAAIRPGVTKLLWLESPSNPMLSVADLVAVSQLAHEFDVFVVVDNTFATPYLQRPLTLGADAVLHSVTKYLGGHSDVVMGAVVSADADFNESLRFHQNAKGSVPSPFDCWIALRGIRTLGVRMDRHCSNAQAVANYLQGHDQVAEVIYPGLASHPDHELAAQQMSDFGGMISFRVAGGESAAAKVCSATKIFTLAESLGGVESLIELPAAMTHQSVAGSELAVPEDLIRISVGIETVDDLIADLAQALS